jgi:hypothetical protein
MSIENMKDGGTAKLEAVSYLNKNTLDTKQLQPEDAMRLNEKPNDGGPAFPRSAAYSPDCGTLAGAEGMSLLDYFAGQAMAGMLANESITNGLDAITDSDGEDVPWVIAMDAYDQAEEMLHERERRMKK